MVSACSPRWSMNSTAASRIRPRSSGPRWTRTAASSPVLMRLPYPLRPRRTAPVPIDATASDRHDPPMADRWYRNAVLYCLDVETFQDSDGDGIGDLRGLVSRLDQLARLGVTCLWL